MNLSIVPPKKYITPSIIAHLIIKNLILEVVLLGSVGVLNLLGLPNRKLIPFVILLLLLIFKFPNVKGLYKIELKGVKGDCLFSLRVFEPCYTSLCLLFGL